MINPVIKADGNDILIGLELIYPESWEESMPMLFDQNHLKMDKWLNRGPLKDLGEMFKEVDQNISF